MKNLFVHIPSSFGQFFIAASLISNGYSIGFTTNRKREIFLSNNASIIASKLAALSSKWKVVLSVCCGYGWFCKPWDRRNVIPGSEAPGTYDVHILSNTFLTCFPDLRWSDIAVQPLFPFLVQNDWHSIKIAIPASSAYRDLECI